ncbi:hypothetical protein BD289DRAFT_453182 [Coniella lustricola]|uniref:Nucleoporin NUP37 n=1 Tax=Coniella lustricola TaxID=2025994 RepID=A0A2T3A8H5_9PEZI|nr:hypothetical protein BD289DRAFT_453182 [Coniella lustricola]
MADLLKPRVRHTAQNTQYTYNVNRRIHDVKTYPILSPQGSSVLLYGHEDGVTVVWRGGRRLKPAKPQAHAAASSKPNGAAEDDAVMIIDSDEEDTAAPAATTSAAFVDRPEFENEVVTDTAGYPEIIQTLDLALGTDVFHIAVLPIAPRPAGQTMEDTSILSEMMVFAVTCASGSVFVLTLPLIPPSHDSKAREELRADLLAGAAGKGKWGETLTQLSSQFSRPADGIAITLVRDGSDSPASSSTRIVVAVHSKDASGTLRLWDFPISQSADKTPLEPFQTELLASPLTGIAFNPSSSHPTQLLAVDSTQAVRIYDYAISAIPQDDLYEGPWPSHGSWLISLYAPFVRGNASTSRKPIVDANWISHGRAILALMADGQWGIWDVEGAGPSGTINDDSTSLFGKYGSALRGAALTAFHASGLLEGSSPLRASGSTSESFASTDSNSNGLRSSLVSAHAHGPERLASVKGGVQVIRLPSQRELVSGEESVVLWIGGSDTLVCVIPIVSKFWETQIRRSVGGGVNLFSGAQPSRMVRLTELNAGLLGERCCGVDAVPKLATRQAAAASSEEQPYDSPTNESTGLPVEVIIRGESRLVVIQDYQDVDTAPLRHPTHKKKLISASKTAESANAIIVHQRPDAPVLTQDFDNLSLRPNSRGNGPRQSIKLFGDSFSQPRDDDMADEPMGHDATPVALPTRPRNMGLEFMDELEAAADAGYEWDAEDRDVEHEIMDLMELDSQLEQMEDERMRGTKRVFFEEG